MLPLLYCRWMGDGDGDGGGDGDRDGMVTVMVMLMEKFDNGDDSS